jgi:Dyp-type peroxidase family
MGAAAMKPSKNAEWKPTAQDATDIQGIVVSAYPKMLSAMFLMVNFAYQADGKQSGPKRWLLDIASRITNATGETAQCINLALSAAGLGAIGVDETVMSTFSRPFREGITAGDRPRFLGDIDTQAPATWSWSDRPSASNCVHAQLMLYAANPTALSSLVSGETKIIGHFGLTIVGRILQQANLDTEGRRREHFGFADGISQPILVDGGKVPVDKRALHEIAAGEIVLGHTNTYGVPSPGPVVAASPMAALHLKEATLRGFFDLGRNGTYLVIRQLKQDVSAFWRNMEKAKNDFLDETGAPATAEWLARKCVGRTQSGEMLIPGGSAVGNEMAFFAKDRRGFGCPVTSHVRRANPRDGLAPKEGDITDIIQATNRHRIMRRGRIYGEPTSDPYINDGVDRGLVFACINSEIERQFEFVQHTWLLNPMFGGAFGESDPLIGPECPFSIPSRPVRQQPTLKTYITARGGGYFFLPSLSAIRYLGELP